MPTTTGHVGINVTSLDRSQLFYSDVFNLTRIGGSDDAGRRFAFLGDGERLVLTLWEQSDARFNPRSSGLHHLSFEVPSSMTRRRSCSRRAAPRSRMTDRAAREGAHSGGIFEDPDGTRLEIYSKDAAGRGAGHGATCGFFYRPGMREVEMQERAGVRARRSRGAIINARSGAAAFVAARCS
jgi:lactoylglutathione lyase